MRHRAVKVSTVGCMGLLLCVGCTPAQPTRYVDLTHPFDQTTVYWPNNPGFTWEKTDWGRTAGGYWYAAAKFSTAEHGGTHMDAPIHFAEGRAALDEIPPDRLVGPAVVIDVRAQSRRDPDYEVTVADLHAWERAEGAMPPEAIVLILTGWSRLWPDRVRYLGTPTPDDPRTLHFPGLSPTAAEFLVAQRHIRGVGIDTASIDPGRAVDFPAHRILNGANVYILENVANLEQLPRRGALVSALPMKIKGGTGGPVRIIAGVP
ncbi:cyclase family protein [Candidatus Nitrospira bockiana]